MGNSTNPYATLPDMAFWKPAVANRHFSEIEETCKELPFGLNDKFGTAGSCFAQHISRELIRIGANFVDLEPAPRQLSESDAKRFGFNAYSCRYGNIYSARQLRQLIEEALGRRTPVERVWERDGRYYDSMRPSVDPVGHESIDDVLQLRAGHLRKVAELFSSIDVFIFTLGLTEAWVDSRDGSVYPVCPGVIAGKFESSKYLFKNFNYGEVLEDLLAARALIKQLNSKIKLLLTISPVPLTATASGEHVLVATTYSKSVLRAVAGDLTRSVDDIFYFPSYELINSHPMRAGFYNPDMRTVNKLGVEFVMANFRRSISVGKGPNALVDTNSNDVVLCDEAALANFWGGKS